MSAVFNTDETRSFIFILTPKKQGAIVNKFQSEKLGHLEIKWYNYLGDPGVQKVGPFMYTTEKDKSALF